MSERHIESLGRPLPENHEADTRSLVQKLLDAKVHLAAVPEVRDEAIGLGYYCYVINLSSF